MFVEQSEVDNFALFNMKLAKLGIDNPSLIDEHLESPINRIVVVDTSILADREIAAGLRIPSLKNTISGEVVYVCSSAILELALKKCQKHSTLIIDGHWLHGERNTHGIWHDATAREIAEDLKRLLKKYPDKISHINLLGCEAGYLERHQKLLPQFDPKAVFFKDDCVPNFKLREMADFRNRAIYRSKSGEFPFARNSLAGQIILSLNNPEIAITATSSRTYPYPADEPSRFNIGSDSDHWPGFHFWKKRQADEPKWYTKLHQVKSITVLTDVCKIKKKWGL